MPSRKRQRFRNGTVALLLLGLAAWIVPSYFSAERYRRRLQFGLERALHRPVRFGAVSFRLLPRPGFAIEDVEVDEDSEFGGEPFARVDHIYCDLRWPSLWRSRMDFAHLSLDHPSFNIVLNSRGQWNVEKLLLQSGVTAPPGAEGTRSPVAAQPLSLDVENARINFQVGSNKKPFAFTDVRARLLVDPAQRRVQFEITASPLRSDLTIPTPGPVEVRGTWAPGADLRGPIEAEMRTRGALLYDWIPVVTGKNPQVYGVIDADVNLAGSLAELTVEGQTTLTQLQRWEELPPSDPMPWTIRFRGRMLRGRERVQVESLDASFADSRLHLSGSVDKLQSDPQLDCVLSLERSRLEDVLGVVRRLWPNRSSWSLKGRVDAMLAIQGAWSKRRYGGYLGTQQASLETPSGSFPVSEIAVRINNRGAVLAPVQITLAPRVTLVAQGAIDRKSLGAQYELQISAKSVPLQDAVSFGRGVGVHALQAIAASGAVTAGIRLAGAAWPPARPTLTAHAELRAARVLIPGLTEPLNLPHASLQINGDQIIVDPAVAVLGTSLFNARLEHRGARGNPWKFDLQATRLSVDQAALWFDALGLRRPLALLERLPGLASFSARRGAATQILGSLNAEGRFSTPLLTYRSVTLKDFQGNFDLSGRTIQMSKAAFRAGGGRGQAEGSADLTNSPPVISGRVALADVGVQALTAHLPGVASQLRGFVDGSGTYLTRGLGHDELAENLVGQMELRLKEVSFEDFDFLGALAEQSHWGKLEPMRKPAAALPATLNVEVRDRSFIFKPAVLDVSGAALRFSGAYDWGGIVNLNVRADFRRLRRRWLWQDEDWSGSAQVSEVRLGGPIDHLVVNPQDGVAAVGRGRGAAVR